MAAIERTLRTSLVDVVSQMNGQIEVFVGEVVVGGVVPEGIVLTRGERKSELVHLGPLGGGSFRSPDRTPIGADLEPIVVFSIGI